MNKVLQAAGRVIRDAQDKGFVLLLDERFELPSVQRFFPPHWLAHRKANTNEQLIQQVKQFWLKIKKTRRKQMKTILVLHTGGTISMSKVAGGSVAPNEKSVDGTRSIIFWQGSFSC